MKILIVGECLSDYLAKCHEAFRTGLRHMFDARVYGKGYPGYDPNIQTYQEIVDHTFPESSPDIIITEFISREDERYPFIGLQQVAGIPKAIILSDYWNTEEAYILNFVEQDGISFILSYFFQPLELFKNTPCGGDRLIYIPPSFDPTIFNDHAMAKSYDVGFLAAGTNNFTDFYPERYAIHQKLMDRKDLRYLWADHPGWERHSSDHPLVGKGFSKKINSCQIFITTGGKPKNLHAKYIEVLASKTLLLADEPEGAKSQGLVDGLTYVKITADDVLEKVDYYLTHHDSRKRITEAGYRLAMQRHNCYTRAMDLYPHLEPNSGENHDNAKHSRYWQNWDKGNATERIDKQGLKNEDPWREQLIRQLGSEFGTDASILEVGCGTGLIYQEMHNHGIVTASSYIGGDFSQNMLAVARRRFPETTFKTLDIFKLDMPDQSQPNVISIHIIQHLPHYREAVKELVRVTKNKLYLVTWFSDTDDDLIQLSNQSETWDGQSFHNNYYSLTRLTDLIQHECGRTVQDIYACHFGGPSYGISVTLDKP